MVRRAGAIFVAVVAIVTVLPWSSDVSAEPPDSVGRPTTTTSTTTTSTTTTPTTTTSTTTTSTTTTSPATTTTSTTVPSGSKVTLCHATSSSTNPYVKLSVPKSQIFGANGHDTHDDDIIPPFDDYPGKNWPSSVVDEDCNPLPAPTTTSTTVPPGTTTTTTTVPETTTTTVPETTTTTVPETTTTTIPSEVFGTTTVPTTTTTVPVTTSTTVPSEVLGATTVPGPQLVTTGPETEVQGINQVRSPQPERRVVPSYGSAGSLAFSGARSEVLVIVASALMLIGMVLAGSALGRRSRSD